MNSFEPYLRIRCYEDVERLILTQIPEDLHLDYKSGQPRDLNRFKTDIAQDVAAFANSDGGMLIIGVIEKNEVPVEIDGVLPNFSRESLGQTIAAKVSPDVPGMRITSHRGPDEKQVLVVEVPRSNNAPHQGPDGKYYRRYEHHNQTMRHHEIEDLRRRQTSVRPLVKVSPGTRGSILTAVDVCNDGDWAADDVSFEFSSTRIWPDGKIPIPLDTGIRHLAAGQRLRFRGTTFSQMNSAGSSPATFSVRVEYTHSLLKSKQSHDWPLDFEAYRESMAVPTDAEQDRRELKEELKKLRESVQAISRTLEYSLRTLTGANGLDLSIYTLRNIERIAKNEPIELLPSRMFDDRGIASALGVEIETATKLAAYLHSGEISDQVLSIRGMTPEILERIRRTFQAGGSVPPLERD